MTCSNTKPNTGYNACTTVDYGLPISVILSPARLEFATEAAAAIEANMTALINAEITSLRAFPLPSVFKAEPADDESVSEVGSLGLSIEARKNGGIDKFHLANIPAKMKNRLMTAWNNRHVYCFFIYANNYLGGVYDEATETKVQMEKVYVTVSEMKNKDTETYKLTFNVQRLDVARANNYGVAVQPAYSLLELKGLQYVTITVTQPLAASADNFTATVVTELESTPVTGLVVADFINLKSGATNALTSAADNGDGTYLITPTDGVTEGSYTFNITTPNALADQTLLIESAGAYSYTVSA